MRRSIGLVRRAWVALGLAATLAACDRATPPPAALPPPSEVRAESVGEFCGMRLLDHDGPKGQAHVAGRSTPLWFSSVRDAIAFMRLPESPRDVQAVYVSDMARARHWDRPDPGAWVEVRQAWYVIDSRRRGGMGAPEAVPFSTAPAAESFRTEHGGRIVRLEGIPDSYVLGPVELHPPAGAASHEGDKP